MEGGGPKPAKARTPWVRQADRITGDLHWPRPALVIDLVPEPRVDRDSCRTPLPPARPTSL